ncbi:hypothetical protein, partial [Rhodopirellula sallentina]|uniref:hypothetical protein n=1 Tax=Rhodopirellula sallentina TaxID=1263869 RepID=UPI001F2EA2B3
SEFAFNRAVWSGNTVHTIEIMGVAFTRVFPRKIVLCRHTFSHRRSCLTLPAFLESLSSVPVRLE